MPEPYVDSSLFPSPPAGEGADASAGVRAIRCTCGTLLPPVEITNPITGEKRVLQAWVKACPVCLAAKEKEQAEKAVVFRQPKRKPRHPYFDDYFLD